MSIVTDSMNKSELRELCKSYSIPGYSKLTKEEMINALAAHGWDASTLDVLPEEATPDLEEPQEEPEAATEQPVPAAPLPEPAAEPDPRTQTLTLPAEPNVNAPKVVKPKVEREKRNGVSRPSAGGKCAAVWDYLDANPTITVKEIREVAAAKGWNANNASCEFYVWRKYNGVAGRAKA